MNTEEATRKLKLYLQHAKEKGHRMECGSDDSFSCRNCSLRIFLFDTQPTQRGDTLYRQQKVFSTPSGPILTCSEQAMDDALA